jgi:hypothetical protein
MQIEKVLGFGSMGMVYFARMWDHKVVVKLIEHGAGILGKEQNRGRLARVEVRGFEPFSTLSSQRFTRQSALLIGWPLCS